MSLPLSEEAKALSLALHEEVRSVMLQLLQLDTAADGTAIMILIM